MQSVPPDTFRALFECSSTPMVVVDDARAYRRANPAACALLRLSRTELLKLRIDDLTPRELCPDLDVLWESFLDEGAQSGLLTLRLPNGGNVEILYSATTNIAPGLHLSFLAAAEDQAIEGAADQGDALHNMPDGAGPARLTPREREVITLLAHGLNGSDIAEQLVLSPETVRIHVRNARGKLGARTRAHAIVLALQAGEITLEPDDGPR